MPVTKTIASPIPFEHYEELRKLAYENNVKIAEIVRAAIAIYLQQKRSGANA